MTINERLAPTLLGCILLGACAATAPRAPRPPVPFEWVYIEVSGEVSGSETPVQVLLVDKHGRRCGCGIDCRDLFWDCSSDCAEPGIPDEIPAADDTIGSFRSSTWDDTAMVVTPAVDAPPIHSAFTIAAHPKATGLLASGACDLWVTPIQTGRVTFRMTAHRGSKKCDAGSFTLVLESGFRYRYRADWRPVADSCSVRITPAGREKVSANSAE
jgi:hypothetical protein